MGAERGRTGGGISTESARIFRVAVSFAYFGVTSGSPTAVNHARTSIFSTIAASVTKSAALVRLPRNQLAPGQQTRRRNLARLIKEKPVSARPPAALRTDNSP